MRNLLQDKSTRELKWLSQTVEKALNFLWDCIPVPVSYWFNQPTVSLEVHIAMVGVSSMCFSAILKTWLKTLNSWDHEVMQGLLTIIFFFHELTPALYKFVKLARKGLVFHSHTRPSSLWRVIIDILGMSHVKARDFRESILLMLKPLAM